MWGGRGQQDITYAHSDAADRAVGGTVHCSAVQSGAGAGAPSSVGTQARDAGTGTAAYGGPSIELYTTLQRGVWSTCLWSWERCSQVADRLHCAASGCLPVKNYVFPTSCFINLSFPGSII